MDARTCGFPGCGRPVEARDLCHAHYRQHQRNRPLKPIRTARGVKLPGLTVSQETAHALSTIGSNLYEGARTVLEQYAAVAMATASTRTTQPEGGVNHDGGPV